MALATVKAVFLYELLIKNKTMKQTAIQQNIDRLEKRIKSLTIKKLTKGVSKEDLFELKFIQSELTENKKLLEVERKDIVDAYHFGSMKGELGIKSFNNGGHYFYSNYSHD